MNKDFKHPVNIYNCEDANEIVPYVINILHPENVIDLGCGLGTWLKCFKDNGVSQVLGVDGSYAEKEQVFRYLSEEEFLEANLENKEEVIEILQTKKCFNGDAFDLAVSLEVAEHLHKGSDEIFIELLTTLGNNILFSAAIPGQGGDGHINEQWPSYWIEKFSRRGFRVLDVIRPLFWNNTNIKVWYKQNMFLFVRDQNYEIIKSRINEICIVPQLTNAVHPDLYISKLHKVPYSFNKFRNIIVGRLKKCLKI